MTDQPAPAEPTPPVSEDPPPPAPAEDDALSSAQQARVAALDVARSLLESAEESPGFARTGARPAPAVAELLEVADYVLTGVRVDYAFDDQANRTPVIMCLTGDLTPDLIGQLNQALASRSDLPATATEEPEEPGPSTPAPATPAAGVLPVAPTSNPVAPAPAAAPAAPVVPEQPTAADVDKRPPPTAPPATPQADPPAGSGG